MAKNDGGQAFPSKTDINNPQTGERIVTHHLGMTRRQWLVGMALQGIIACLDTNESYEDTAKEAYAFADAILDYEEKEGKDVQEPKLG